MGRGDGAHQRGMGEVVLEARWLNGAVLDSLYNPNFPAEKCEYITYFSM